jgi:hypothetical protein
LACGGPTLLEVGADEPSTELGGCRVVVIASAVRTKTTTTT